MTLKNESININTVAEYLEQSSVIVSKNNNDQACAIQETAVSMDQIIRMVSKTDKNANELLVSTKNAQESAKEGSVAMGKMMEAMKKISDSNTQVMGKIDEGNKKINEIVKVIADIGEKTKVINDIVFQTKLLSFNASVEAARAGEYGKGFAVVAEEVGKLAEMSGNSAKEISTMLASGIERVKNIISENKQQVDQFVVDGKNTILEGMQVAERAGSTMNELIRQNGEISEMIGEITTGIEEQTKGVQEISKAINILNQATTMGAEVSVKNSDSSKNLMSQSKSLTSLVDEIKTVVFGTENLIHEKSVSENHNVHFLKTKKEAREKNIFGPSGDLAKASGDSSSPASDDVRFKDI